ncbi:MAG: aromatic acid exporter family protein [Lachnospiraceae bacterium]|nr:aromatic acid exporter family protein [Lachnospiraceae bacterium]
MYLLNDRKLHLDETLGPCYHTPGICLPTKGMRTITKPAGKLQNRLQNKLHNINLWYLLKTGIGTALAIILASRFGLAYSPSAGIITLLTIQNTKKETISIAFRRILAFILAVFIAYGIFTGFGYTSAAFGGFALLFVALCNALRLQDGISMNAVLTTHFLIEQRMDLPMILNEVALLLIGMGIGITINLIMPKNRKQIQIEQLAFEEEMKKILRSLANALEEKTACLIPEESRYLYQLDNELTKAAVHKSAKTDFTQLESNLSLLLKRAYENSGNTLIADTRYLVSYFEMRKLQIDVLKTISHHIDQIPVVLQQTIPITDFMNRVADSFHELNNVKELLEEMEQLYGYYRKEQLPKTREEFEYRAILFQILKELEYFLRLKRNFILDLENKDMKSYWKQEKE